MSGFEHGGHTAGIRQTLRGAALSLALAMLAGCATVPAPITPATSEDQYKRLAREVFDETNALRTDPVAYIAILTDITQRMTGKVYQPLDSEIRILTQEGPSAVQEAIEVLRDQPSLRKLQWSDELAELARAHVLDTGPKGLVSHDSSAGQTFSDRVARVITGDKFSAGAENLSYGYDNARDVVSQLFIDDGVPDRGHRTNLLKPPLTHTGVACGYHRRFGHMCAAIYAAR